MARFSPDLTLNSCVQGLFSLSLSRAGRELSEALIEVAGSQQVAVDHEREQDYKIVCV